MNSESHFDTRFEIVNASRIRRGQTGVPDRCEIARFKLGVFCLGDISKSRIRRQRDKEHYEDEVEDEDQEVKREEEDKEEDEYEK